MEYFLCWSDGTVPLLLISHRHSNWYSIWNFAVHFVLSSYGEFILWFVILCVNVQSLHWMYIYCWFIVYIHCLRWTGIHSLSSLSSIVNISYSFVFGLFMPCRCPLHRKRYDSFHGKLEVVHFGYCPVFEWIVVILWNYLLCHCVCSFFSESFCLEIHETDHQISGFWEIQNMHWPKTFL